MKITNIGFIGTPNGDFIRYVHVVIDGHFAIRGIKLIHRPDDSILVAMPSRKKMDDTHEDIVYPVNKAARSEMEKAILSAWEKLQAKNV